MKPKILTALLTVSLLFSQDLAMGQEVSAEPRTLAGVRDKYPSWSPDGKLIVFSSTRMSKNLQIFIMNADGTNIKQLTNSEVGHNDTPVFSPDGTTITFMSSRDGNSEVYLMDANGGNERVLLPDPGRDIHPKWSPDGTSIIFNNNRLGPMTVELFEIDVQTETLTRLTNSPFIDTYPEISPDGSKILWHRMMFPEGGPPNPATANSEIFVSSRDGSNALNISNTEAADMYPRWSNDGSKILFSSDRETGREANLYVMDPDGSNVVQITPTIPGTLQIRGSWSPDGSKIVFNRENRQLGATWIVVLDAPDKK